MDTRWLAGCGAGSSKSGVVVPAEQLPGDLQDAYLAFELWLAVLSCCVEAEEVSENCIRLESSPLTTFPVEARAAPSGAVGEEVLGLRSCWRTVGATVVRSCFC